MTTVPDGTASGARLVDSPTIQAMAWQEAPEFPGVTYKVLWKSGRSTAGIMHVPAEAAVSLHTHEEPHHHHMWVIDGAGEMIGKRVGVGSYLHVPPGVEHGVLPLGPAGCTYFYVDLGAEES